MPKQIEKTEIYILFPECNDNGHIVSAPYLGTYDFVWHDALPIEVEKMLDIVSMFRHEYAIWFFDGANVEGMLFPYNVLEEYPTPIDEWNSCVVAYGLLDWRDDKDITAQSATYAGQQLNSDTLATAYWRNKINTRTSVVHATILGVKSAMLPQGKVVLQNHKQKSISVSICHSDLELYKWLCTNRLPQRVFVYDSKHGENRKNRRRGKNGVINCPLRCSLLRAQSLLEKAIGNGDRESMLWYFDDKENRCIIFENQCEQLRPAFHGYHVESIDDNFDEIDFDLLKRVCNLPKKIK